MNPAAPLPFPESPRFEIRRLVGSGGMGVVYEADDKERNDVVALKVMRNIEPRALLRFKNEFRALAGISHPRLLTLYELFSEGDRWYFTMELVEGVSFMEHVRVASSFADAPTAATGELTLPAMDLGLGESHPSEDMARVVPRTPTGLDLTRFRPALAQLAEGVHALHQAHYLHCDIKPSNVLVRRDGQLVLLDFGLVQQMGGGKSTSRSGTAVYMAPEQATGGRLTEATDWYAVGVLLYEALTGSPPFVGRADSVLERKLAVDPPPPSARRRGVPGDLDQLCMALLARDPAARPRGEEILARLGVASSRPPALARGGTGGVFLGRETATRALQDAFESVLDGNATTVLVSGTSGMGKSALVEHFAAQVAELPRAVVLAGRCYERESVPYKALDRIVDALADLLDDMPPAERAALVPGDLPLLARLFPVLQRLTTSPAATGMDPKELRRRGLAALRRLLADLAATRPVMLFIDDLQWSDADSALLLVELLRPPQPPALLLVATYRSDAALGLDRAQLGRVVDLSVDALAPEEAARLAIQLGAPPAAAERIARESGGNPFFIGELARFAELENVTLAEALQRRMGALPEEARHLLTIIAVAGRPVSLDVAIAAAGSPSSPRKSLALLEAENLVRPHGADHVETYHDRIREAAVDALDLADLVAAHRGLAEALERAGAADPDALVEHWLGAGESTRAASHAATAAGLALVAVAFRRAAELYGIALEHGQWPQAERVALRTGLGDALANAGRGPEAAAAYLAAAAEARGEQALELRRRAAERLLHSGHFDEGLVVVRDVLAQVGERLAPSPRAAILSLLFHRLRLRLRGLDYEERAEADVPAADLMRTDTLWSVTTGMMLSDTMHGLDFQTRHLLAALQTGETYRIGRGLAMELAHAAVGGSRNRARTADVLQRTFGIAEASTSPHIKGLAWGTAAAAAFLSGNWRLGHDRARIADAIFRGECRNVAWEIATTDFFLVHALFCLGEFGELARLVPERVRDATDRGDLFAAVGIRSGRNNVAWLAMDDPAEAERQIDEAARFWTQQGFHLQHYYELSARTQLDWYTGDGERALARMQATWPRLARSLLFQVQNVDIEAHSMRGLSVVAARDRRLLRLAMSDARRLERQDVVWASALATLIRAGVLAVRGELELAVDRYRDAAALFDASDMHLYAAACRWRWGLLRNDADGRAAVVAARAIIARGCADPEKMLALLAP